MLDIITKEPDFDVVIDPAIFNEIYKPYLSCMSRVQITYGGASSGKSVFKAQQVVIDLMNGGRNYLICRAVGKTIKRSVFNEIKRRIDEFGVGELFTINRTEFTITCINGYQAFFVGLDDVEKIKSIVPEVGAITDIWIEEATEIERNTLKSLRRRQRGGSERTPKRLHLTFNPILNDHWIYNEFFAPIGWNDDDTEYMSDELSILKSWFIHNKFLTKQDVDDLLNEEDKYFSDVYTWGKWGVLGNTIFKNYEIADLSSLIPTFDNIRNGGDFGFASDPAALGRMHWNKKKKELYIFEEYYERDIVNDELATECLRMFGKEEVRFDSSEPKSIRELRNAGVNAVPAIKGPDSVLHGIQWLQGIKLIIHKECINTANEVRQAKWKEGSDGKPLSPPRPVDKNNHMLDLIRYAMERDMLETPTRGRQWPG